MGSQHLGTNAACSDNLDQTTELVSSREAAAYLGVKARTLYTYVSRGLLRSISSAEGTSRLYVYDDLKRLRARSDARAGHRAVAQTALEYGHPVLDTRISTISAAGPQYRGHAAIHLAERGIPFESVAELLWTGSLPKAVPAWFSAMPVKSTECALHEFLRVSPHGPGRSPAPIVLFRLLTLLHTSHVRGPSDTMASVLDAARALLRLFATLPGAYGDPRRAPPLRETPGGVARTLLRSLGVTEQALASEWRRAVLDQALVLAADNELDTCTFAARVAASAGSDLHTCIGAGLATLGGAKTGGACGQIEAMLDKLENPADAARTVSRASRAYEPLPGFGHALYPNGDPRAGPLLSAARKVASDNRRVCALLTLADAALKAGYGHPTLEFGLVAACAAIDMAPGSALTVLAVGRAAGFVAHILEEWTRDRLIRPQARYIGP